MLIVHDKKGIDGCFVDPVGNRVTLDPERRNKLKKAFVCLALATVHRQTCAHHQALILRP